ncbi:ECF-type sigma factor [Pseudolysobacter antarcticus]|uniref:ECF-type sigma factor n=1 Tax=Pseudolysobacter antarcticus TaxID=2511995 RepID=UPI0013EDB184|nr:ECF-type sigma factor [Pseudolysobacter antarcticus]
MSDTTQQGRTQAAADTALPEHLDARVYSELMKLARAQLARAGTMSLDAPSLVHEAYLRLQRQGAINAAQRNIFFAYSAQVMRSVIIDYVRERRAQKRGGGERLLTLTTGIPGIDIGEDSIEHLHESMQALRQIDERSHQVVELRYFGGLTEAEIADVLGVSVPTVKRDWRKARAFLFDAMGTTG